MNNELLKKIKIIAIAILFIGASFLPQVGALDQTKIKENNNETTNQVNSDTEYWALLVAVAIYADDPQQNRPLMLEEVDDFYDLLLECPWWQEDHIKVIKGEDATIKNILEGLKWLDEMENEDDISLVYITTHGFPLGVDIPPTDEADGTDEALVSFWGFAYPNLYIWDDELNFYLNQLESYGVCLIVDSCYAGGFNDPPNLNILDRRFHTTKADNTKSVSDWIKGFAEDVSGQGRVVLMASCEDEVSYSGGFAPYLIDALRGYGDNNIDGVITAEEAFFYTEPRTTMQHPTMYDGFPGELPLLTSNVESDPNKKHYRKDFIRNQGNEKTLSSENARICGYVTDINTDQAIENAIIEVINGDYWDGYWNETISNSTGYYSINVAAGGIRMFASGKGYMQEHFEPFEIYENEVKWVNVTLEPHPEEKSKVCGFITDSETNDPIEDAFVLLRWGNWWNGYWNETYSDLSGFFSINVAAGIFDLYFDSNGYIPNYSDRYKIFDFETLWLNISLIPKPPENSVLCGYITDYETGFPIDNAMVYLEWQDEHNNIIENQTHTDVSGFYSMNVAAGETHLYIYASDYREESTYRNDAQENDILWINTSMEPDIIQVDLQKPLSAIYVNNNRIIPYPKCIILGNIEVEVFVHDFWFRPRNDDAVKVEFYIDDVLKDTVFTEPFTYTYSEKVNGDHKIKVVAYDEDGNSVEDEIKVRKFF